MTLSQGMARRVRFVRGARWILTPCASCTQRDAHGSRVGQLQSNWTLSISGMMRPGTVAAYRIIARPGTKLDAVRFAAADAARQMPTIGGHVPKTLAPVTLQHAVRRLRYIRRLRSIIPVIRRCASRRYTGGTRGITAAATPPAFRDGIETCHLEKVQTLT